MLGLSSSEEKGKLDLMKAQFDNSKGRRQVWRRVKRRGQKTRGEDYIMECLVFQTRIDGK
jgi:hypothetical protein